MMKSKWCNRLVNRRISSYAIPKAQWFMAVRRYMWLWRIVTALPTCSWFELLRLINSGVPLGNPQGDWFDGCRGTTCFVGLEIPRDT